MTKAMEFHAHSFNVEALGNLAEQLRRFKCALAEIKYRFALRADEVMMMFGDGIHANGAVMKAEFA